MAERENAAAPVAGPKWARRACNRVLERLSPRTRADMSWSVLDAPDDAAVSSVPPGKLLVQTVDEFPALIDDPYIFGKIASNHALGDVFAMGAEPWTALAMATLPWGPDEKMEAMLEDLLRGSLEVLEAAGAVLVGGHTTEGTRLVFGLAVSGLVDPERVLRKGGLLPGQILVLTKPLGTGALFAAEMRQKSSRAVARRRDRVDCFARTGTTARILARHGATACTDVTGFGLVRALGGDAAGLRRERPPAGERCPAPRRRARDCVRRASTARSFRRTPGRCGPRTSTTIWRAKHASLSSRIRRRRAGSLPESPRRMSMLASLSYGAPATRKPLRSASWRRGATKES
jgi:selenium donor protein